MADPDPSWTHVPAGYVNALRRGFWVLMVVCVVLAVLFIVGAVVTFPAAVLVSIGVSGLVAIGAAVWITGR